MKAVHFSHVTEGIYVADEAPSLLFYSPESGGAPRTLAEAIETAGCLIFCSTPPGDLADFARRMQVCWRDPSLKIVWLQSPYRLADPGELRGLRITGNHLIDRGVFHVRNYVLQLPPDSKLQAAPGLLMTLENPLSNTRMLSAPGRFMGIM